MEMNRRKFLASTAGAAAAFTVPGMTGQVFAQEKIVRFSFPQDFTKIYTFVTSEYSQGQRDYITLVNERGGIGGSSGGDQ